MYALDRTHRLGEDLDWLPRELKVLRWTTTAASWIGVSTLALAATLASAGALAHVAAIGAAGGIFAGGRFGRALVLRRLGRLVRGRLDIVRLGAEPEGQLVHVAGKVIATTTLPSFLHAVPAVYRRMTFRLRGRLVHEAAVDFDLMDAEGERLRVHAGGARLFVPLPRDPVDYPISHFTQRPLPPSLARVVEPDAAWLLDQRAVPAAEVVLAPGAEVDVIGFKTETPDPIAGSRVGRGPPMRVALRSGRIPLVVTPRLPVEPGDGL